MAEASASPADPALPLNELTCTVDDLLEKHWDDPVKALGTPTGDWDVPLKAAGLQEKLQAVADKIKIGSRLPNFRRDVRSPGLWRRPSRPPH